MIHSQAEAEFALAGAAVAHLDDELGGGLVEPAVGLAVGLVVPDVGLVLATQRLALEQVSGALQSVALAQVLVTTVRLNFLPGSRR